VEQKTFVVKKSRFFHLYILKQAVEKHLLRHCEERFLQACPSII